jgi:hypothetical protein
MTCATQHRYRGAARSMVSVLPADNCKDSFVGRTPLAGLQGAATDHLPSSSRRPVLLV